MTPASESMHLQPLKNTRYCGKFPPLTTASRGVKSEVMAVKYKRSFGAEPLPSGLGLRQQCSVDGMSNVSGISIGWKGA